MWNYLEDLHKLVGNLYERMSKIQDNLKEMKSVMREWSTQPLFERKDGKKVLKVLFSNVLHRGIFTELIDLIIFHFQDNLLNLDDRSERRNKRYSDIVNTAQRINELLKENMELFNMQNNQDSEIWINYVVLIDNLMKEALFKSVACRYYKLIHGQIKSKISMLNMVFNHIYFVFLLVWGI